MGESFPARLGRVDHARLEMAVEATSLGIWEWSIETGEVYWSERQREIFGLTLDHPASYEVWASRLYPDDSEWVQTQVKRLLNTKSGGRMHLQHRLLLPSGKVRWIETHGRMIYHDDRPIRLLGTATDITSRKESEEAHVQALASLEVTLDGADAVPWQYNTQTRELRWSQRVTRLLKLPSEARYPSLDDFLAHVHPEHQQQIIEIREKERLAASGTKFTVQVKLRRADGTWGWMERRSITGSEEPTGRWVYGVDLDISERKQAEERVRENEERLRSLTANMPSAMVYQVVVSASGKRQFSFVAENCIEINGISATEVLNNPAVLYEMMLPDYRQAFIEAEEAALQKGERFDYMVPMKKSRGEVRWYRISSAPRSGHNGDTLWDGIQVDITERINAESAQKQAVAEKEHLAAEREAVLGQLAEGVIVTNSAGEVTYVNKAAAAIHGAAKLRVPVEDYSSEYQLFTNEGEPYPSHLLPLARAVVNRETVSNEKWRIRRSDSTEVVAIGSASPVYRNDGSFLGAVLTLRDDTARHEAELALRQSEARFRGLFEQSPLLIHIFDPLGNSITVNPVLERAFRIKAEDLSRYNILTDPQLREGLTRELLEKAFAGEVIRSPPTRHDASVSIGQGNTRWVESTAYPVRDVHEQIREVVILSQDVTERVDAEQHVRLLMREVNHRSKNLLSVVQAIASQTAIKGDPKLFAETFSERLQGLAASHDLLVQNSWEEVDLKDLVLSQLSHFKSLVGHRIRIIGEPLSVNTSAAQTLGMALHELATNAGKYGSLSNTHGTVLIEWEVTSITGSDMLRMSWTENGGPPVQKPGREGFGTILIKYTAATSLQGTVELDYAETGIQWTLLAPTNHVIRK